MLPPAIRLPLWNTVRPVAVAVIEIVPSALIDPEQTQLWLRNSFTVSLSDLTDLKNDPLYRAFGGRFVSHSVLHSGRNDSSLTLSVTGDPNLGRILAAVGYAGITDLDQTRIDLYLDQVHVARQGGRHPEYREEDGQRVMKQSEITVRVALGRGPASDTVWTCDFSHDYVSINADYRS